MNISVLICTHNPLREYIDRVIGSLKVQSLSTDEWELILVDNASASLLSEEVDLCWHPLARHIREEELGLTPARLRGIMESTGEIVVFVDDDNLLSPDYLENAVGISRDWPVLGAWGGNVHPEFEKEPDTWTKPYWNFLAIRDFDQDYWSNDFDHWQSQPCGAGLCVRRFVAEKYVELTRNSVLKSELDRRGNQLTSCGDTDIVLTAKEFNLGFGVFKRLSLIHIIPARRIEEDYLIELVKGITFSLHLLRYSRTGKSIQRKKSVFIYLRHFLKLVFLSRRDRKFYLAKRKAGALAAKRIKAIGRLP